MDIYQHRIQYRTRSAVFKLWALGDIHFGARSVDKVKLRKTLKFIEEDKYSYILLMGDIIDGVTHRDKRFNPARMDQTYSLQDLTNVGKTQTEQAYEFLKPVKDKIICSIQGNHEWKLWKDTGYDSSAELAHLIGCEYLGYSGYLNMTFTRMGKNTRGTANSFIIYMHHGAGSASSQGGAANKLTKLVTKFDADIYLQGHIHRPQIQPMTTLEYDKNTNQVKERKRILAYSGSYLKTYPTAADDNFSKQSTYGERAQYDPVTVGAVTIVIKPDQQLFDGRYNLVDFGV